MKILLTVDPEIPVPPALYGGIERIVEGLVHEYVRQGHDVTLCANKDSKVPCRLVGWPGSRSQHLPDVLKNSLMLTKLVFKERFDVVHSFSRLAYMSALLLSRVPKIMSYQREPSLSQVRKAVKLARKGSLLFTGCSSYIADKIKDIGEAHAVYNFAPVEKYSAEKLISADAPLAFLGRMESIKGPHIAIEVAKGANRRLVLAGNIPPGGQGWFDEYIRPHLDDGWVTYVGPVNDAQKNELLGKALGFLMPIQWNEPFGIVMAEAMACGTPVLGFPFGSVPEVIQDGINGFICSNTEEMIGRVKELVAIDRQTVRRTAEEKFSNTKIVADYLELYKIMINRVPK
jgi:glycosyltransferase involved in cell wall biosynthesis